MKIVPTKVLVALLLMVSSALPAAAANQGKLPDGAVPLTPTESQAFFVGHSVKYELPTGVVRYTWTPDGKALGTWEGKNGDHSPADGTWTSSGNEFCYTVDFYNTNDGKSVNHRAVCMQLWKVGKAIWLKNTVDQPQFQGDIYPGEGAHLTKGDQVSARHTKFKSKLPPS
jgi:Protein of unknown function (DUF995)